MNDQQLSDQLYRFGGGASSSTLTLGTLILFLIVVVLLFALPKKYVVVPFLFASIFIPYSQVIVIGGLHFNIFRMILPFAWIRALAGKNAGQADGKFKLNGLDKAIVLWALTDAICATLLWGSWGAFVNRLGSLYNVFGIYFLLRLLIRDRDDVNRMIRVFAAVCALTAVFMILEQVNGRNVFSVFGGVSEFTAVRDGRIRSQAAFAHAIIAGTLGANLLPLFVGAWWQGAGMKKFGVLGILSALVMIVCSSSATPVGACVAGIGGLCMWPFRRNLKPFRWGLVISLIGLNMVMKAPVWALIGRISIVGGSSYHRYELVNQAILRFGEWWMLGTKNPGSWGYDMWDISNAYVNVAVDGGFFALLFFLAIFWQGFRKLGIARHAAEGDRKLELQVWSFGAALLATVLAYFGIWYFDQSVVVWWALLAMICAITSSAMEKVPETAVDRVEEKSSWARKPAPVAVPVAREGRGIGARLRPTGFPAEKTPIMDPYRR